MLNTTWFNVGNNTENLVLGVNASENQFAPYNPDVAVTVASVWQGESSERRINEWLLIADLGFFLNYQSF